jgi:hypothetical protein
MSPILTGPSRPPMLHDFICADCGDIFQVMKPRPAGALCVICNRRKNERNRRARKQRYEGAIR